VPATLQAELRPYQLDGYHWLHYLWSHDLGGILADDMGLGKTLQALALICQAKLARPDAPPFLVVAPTTVVSNWLSETARFAPELKVVALTESTARRRGSVTDAVAGADLVVTSYALLRIEIDRLVDQSWSGMILDEAQFVKNHRARTHQCAQRIVAPFKLAVTGTPLENSLMDLWALLSLTAPGLFPHADRFAEYYRRPIERHGDAGRLRQLQRRIRPLMLRRTKASVAAELPPKAEQVVTVDLDPRHRRLYQTHLQRERQKVLGLIDDLDHNRFTVLRSLTLLRRLSLDPALVDEAHSAIPAAKVEVLVGDLTEVVQEGHQALVFSQFTSFLGRIRTRLDDAGISYAYLDGRTRQRDRVVNRFRSGEASVFLISLKAGGFGLNLTEASYCFVLDPWWNPATEAQAVDRTHRIGQTKPVMVYRLVARGTIEEKVMALKARKSELFGSVFSDDDGLASHALTAEEIRGLIGA
jgi:SNF2 family DNA or RNA helicase